MRFILQNGAGTYELSAILTWLIIVGGVYGCVRLLVDVWHSFTRGNVTLIRERPKAKAEEPDHR